MRKDGGVGSWEGAMGKEQWRGRSVMEGAIGEEQWRGRWGRGGSGGVVVEGQWERGRWKLRTR